MFSQYLCTAFRKKQFHPNLGGTRHVYSAWLLQNTSQEMSFNTLDYILSDQFFSNTRTLIHYTCLCLQLHCDTHLIIFTCFLIWIQLEWYNRAWHLARFRQRWYSHGSWWSGHSFPYLSSSCKYSDVQVVGGWGVCVCVTTTQAPSKTRPNQKGFHDVNFVPSVHLLPGLGSPIWLELSEFHLLPTRLHLHWWCVCREGLTSPSGHKS